MLELRFSARRWSSRWSVFCTAFFANGCATRSSVNSNIQPQFVSREFFKKISKNRKNWVTGQKKAVIDTWLASSQAESFLCPTELLFSK
jgi:hypothetical protein